jgi:hypothetical protein
MRVTDSDVMELSRQFSKLADIMRARETFQRIGRPHDRVGYITEVPGTPLVALSKNDMLGLLEWLENYTRTQLRDAGVDL